MNTPGPSLLSRSRAAVAGLFVLASTLVTTPAAEPAPARLLERTNLLVYLNDLGQPEPIQTVADWPKRRAAILAAMQQVMGPLPGRERQCPLDMQVTHQTDGGEFFCRAITYASEPGSRVPAYLLVPKEVITRGAVVPAVLALHQTHPAGNKVVVGLGASPDDEYGVALARRGYAVLAPAYPQWANYWPDLKQLGYQSGTMKAIWDNRRGLDLLASLPWVKTNGFGVIGHSLGGHNGIFTAVFDERLKVVVSSCGFDSFRDYMDGNIKGWTQERYMPKLRDHPLAEIPFDFPELLGALAPRACFISAPLGDTNFKWRSVAAVVAAARPVYQLHRRPQNLMLEQPDCGHLFPADLREAAYRLLDAHLK